MGKFLYFPFLYRKEHQQSLANPFKVVVVVIIVVSAEVIVVICDAAPTPPSSLDLLKESKHWTRAKIGRAEKFGLFQEADKGCHLQQLLAKNVKARDY